MKKLNLAIGLTEQLLDQAKIDDEQRKARAIRDSDATAAAGEGYWPFHLKHLLDLLEEQKSEGAQARDLKL